MRRLFYCVALAAGLLMSTGCCCCGGSGCCDWMGCGGTSCAQPVNPAPVY
ncbi:MAG: hypothetical protein JW888_13085 [Pirellulales bacterium]|nr:hypothetical protein [Pirellulales bacterium]